MAGNKPPAKPGVRVTDFTSWIMSLYLDPPRSKSLKAGKKIEKLVSCFSKPVSNSNWSLLYKDQLDGIPNLLRISALRVNGEPLRGAPDLVYEQKETGDIIIVERKSHHGEIPSDGWPNLKAQLWAYSYIDLFRAARRIHLVGEVWGYTNGGITRKAILHWNRNDHRFSQNNSELFKLYGGTIHTSNDLEDSQKGSVPQEH